MLFFTTNIKFYATDHDTHSVTSETAFKLRTNVIKCYTGNQTYMMAVEWMRNSNNVPGQLHCDQNEEFLVAHSAPS